MTASGPPGDRPDGGAFDAVFWDEAMMFPGGAADRGRASLAAVLRLHRFEPHPEWASSICAGGTMRTSCRCAPYAAGIPGECRVIYLPLRWYHWDGPLVCHLEPGVRYRAAYIEPNTMRRHELGEITGDAKASGAGRRCRICTTGCCC